MGRSAVCPVCGERIPESSIVTLPDGGYAFTCPACGKDTSRPAVTGHSDKVCPVCGEPFPASARVSLPEGAYACTCPRCGKSTTYFAHEPGVPHINQ